MGKSHSCLTSIEAPLRLPRQPLIRPCRFHSQEHPSNPLHTTDSLQGADSHA